MSRLRIEYTRQAEEDILEISFYIAQERGKEVAYRFIEKVTETCELMAGSPLMGRPREELSENLRSHPVGRYGIYYRSLAGRIIIVRVLHGSRDISEKLF